MEEGYKNRQQTCDIVFLSEQSKCAHSAAIKLYG